MEEDPPHLDSSKEEPHANDSLTEDSYVDDFPTGESNAMDPLTEDSYVEGFPTGESNVVDPPIQDAKKTETKKVIPAIPRLYALYAVEHLPGCLSDKQSAVPSCEMQRLYLHPN